MTLCTSGANASAWPMRIGMTPLASVSRVAPSNAATEAAPQEVSMARMRMGFGQRVMSVPAP